MIFALLRSLFSLWAALILLLFMLRLLGTIAPCFCFAFSAPPLEYGLTELRLWDARTGISLILAEAPFIGDVISPQSRTYLAYVQAGNGVQLVNLWLNGQSQLIDFATVGLAAPHLSPDGHYLVYSLAPRSGDGLYLQESNSTNQRRIAPYPLSVTWQPDSQSLLYSLRNRRLRRFELYQYTLATDEQRLLLSNEHGFFDMDLSPDGQKLLYISRQSLWLYDFASQTHIPLETQELSRMPRWSADNHYAYQIRRADGLYLRIVDTDGSRISLPNPAMNPSHAFVWWHPQ